MEKLNQIKDEDSVPSVKSATARSYPGVIPGKAHGEGKKEGGEAKSQGKQMDKCKLMIVESK